MRLYGGAIFGGVRYNTINCNRRRYRIVAYVEAVRQPGEPVTTRSWLWQEK